MIQEGRNVEAAEIPAVPGTVKAVSAARPARPAGATIARTDLRKIRGEDRQQLIAELEKMEPGIGNMYNRFLGAPYAWYEEGWLITKLCLFAVVMVNAIFVGPSLGKGRMMLIKQTAEGKAPEGSNAQLKRLDRKSTMLFIIQAALVLAILALSGFGPGKHPGVI